MRHEVNFLLNGRRRVVSGRLAFGSLAEYLRDECRMVGTKVGCGEGDCGACTVLVGQPSGGTIRYRPAASCILTPCQVDSAHVVTVEGIRDGQALSPIQESMVEHHGSQCGYCTPGVVMALTGLLEIDPSPDEDALRTALTGNLCRCTGYLPILQAGLNFDRDRHRVLAEIYPDPRWTEDLWAIASEPIRVEAGSGPGRRIFFRPDQVSDAVKFKADHPGAVVISGGTDLGVWRNRRGFDPPHLLSLAGLADWASIRLEGGSVSIGANVTWATLEEFASREAPALLGVARHFASPQIRNVATFVGNVAHGSPIADSVGFLHVVDARLDLVGPLGTRTVPVADFFTGYRETVLAADEVISRVVVPLPPPGERVGLYKISKRKEMDISTFRAAIRVRESGGRIERAALAFAGVGPKVIRLPETEAYLVGRPFAESTFVEAGRRARAEVEPISDLRGSRDFRLILAENVLRKYFRESLRPGREGPSDAG